MECYLKTLIKQNVKCCQCQGTLADSKTLNVVTTDKVATWKFPASGSVNVFIPNAPYNAVAIICDRCAESGDIKPKFAIEAEAGCRKVTYHEIESLDDEPEWVKKAKKKLSKPSPVMN